MDAAKLVGRSGGHRFEPGESPFRVRPGRGRSEAAPPAAGIRRIAQALVAKKTGARVAPGKGGRRGPALRGAKGASAQRASRSMQRVIVKARVVVNAAGKGGQGGKAGLAKHVDYLERDEVREDGEHGRMFDEAGELTPDEVEKFTADAAGDRHHFRFIVSPEKGAELHLEDYARDFVQQMEADLGTRVQWAGVVHTNTDNPHVHLIVRGVDERGADLVMSRDYISHGLRHNAQEIATRYLGPRLESELEQEREANIRADRMTVIDRGLVRQAEAASDRIVSTRAPEGGESERAYKQRLTDTGRLQHLEGLGLAEEVEPGRWRLDPGLVDRLRTMGQRQDIVKNLHARLGPRDRPADVVLYNKEAAPGKQIVGEVIDRGPVDELTDRRYVVVNGVDGKAYHVTLSQFSEKPGKEARVGTIVALKTVERPAVSAADKNIADLAAANGGVYDASKHLSQVEAGAIKLPAGANAAEYVARHLKRAEGHARRNLVEAVDSSRFRVPPGLTDKLTELAKAKGRDAGAYVEVGHESGLTLREQMAATGPTWLDGKLAAGEHLGEQPRLGASRFQGRLRAAMRARMAVLRQRGLVIQKDGQAQLRAGALDELYQQEHAAKVAALARKHGRHEPLKPGERFAGKVERIERLASGDHALVSDGGRFVLVPARAGLDRQIGQRVELTMGRGGVKAPDRAMPMQMQAPLRYAATQARERTAPSRSR